MPYCQELGDGGHQAPQTGTVKWMDWNNEIDPYVMLQVVGGEVTERKLRLFACAAARQVWPLLVDPRTRTAVEVAQRYADGLATADELRAAHEAALAASGDASAEMQDILARADPQTDRWPIFVSILEYAAAANVGVWATDLEIGPADPRWGAHRAYFVEQVRDSVCTAAVHNVSPTLPLGPPPDEVARQAAGEAEMRVLASIVRCLIPDPARTIHIEERWQSATVLSLATGIYEEKAFDRMPILADALQDAGCDNEEILNHCRQPGVHSRGCYVVDLLLGKS